MSYSKLKIIQENKDNIDLSQYGVLNNIEEQIRLNLLMNEKLLQLKKALFIQKLTNENIIYEISWNDRTIFLNEENFKKYKIESAYNTLKIHKHDIGKIRLKTLEI